MNMKTKIISIAAMLLFAASATSTFAATPQEAPAGSVCNSAIKINTDNWYYCSTHLDWCSGGAFNNADLGELSVLTLGGQSQIYNRNGDDNNTWYNWNAGSTMTMWYKIDNGNPQSITLTIFRWNVNDKGEQDKGNKMLFQSGGSNFEGTDIDLSNYKDGNDHYLAVWFESAGVYDNNGGPNYVAKFKVKSPKLIESSADFSSVNSGDDVQLSGLTIFKDGDWNTLCLPFNLTRGDYEMSPLKHATEIRTLSSSSLNEGTLTLTFSDPLSVNEPNDVLITAGTPYIIKWASGGGEVANPIFTSVTIPSNIQVLPVQGSGVTFKGTFNEINFTEENKNILFLGTGSTLYYPLDGASIGAFRAYFELSSGLQVKAINLNFGDEETSIKQINSTESATDTYYTIDGRHLNEKPATAGLYIINGKKVVIK